MPSLSRHAWLLTAMLCLSLPGTVHAGPAGNVVTDFFDNLDTLQADFHQEVRDGDNTVQQVSDGKVWIQRPGRFRWNYDSPYKQQLVSDGERLWSYDEDLEQVTIQPVGAILSATPAMLLSGNEPIEQIFTVEPLPANGNKQQVLLKPKSDDSNVTVLLLDFTDGIIAGIRAEDDFGNITTFVFTRLVRNSTLDSTLFQFKPPAGVDIVGNPD
ncbi:MAG: outer membrane lipoprotein chaperone LolA [Pseudomonadota bacterium]